MRRKQAIYVIPSIAYLLRAVLSSHMLQRMTRSRMGVFPWVTFTSVPLYLMPAGFHACLHVSFFNSHVCMRLSSAMSGRETELTITSSTMLWGLYRYGLHEFDGHVPPQIDQITFITMACDELEKMKKTTHNPLTARPTPPTPVTKPQSSPSLAGDDT